MGIADEEFLDPASNYNSVWSNNSFANLIKATRFPTIPATSPQVSANESDDNEEQAYVPAPFATLHIITKIEFYYFAQAFDEHSFFPKLYIGGSSVGAITTPGPESWAIITALGNWVRSDFDSGFRFALLSGAVGGKDDGSIIWRQGYIKATGLR